MSDLKLIDMPELDEAPDADDLLYILDDPYGTPVDKKITIENAFESKAAKGANNDITSLSNLAVHSLSSDVVTYHYGVTWERIWDSYTRTGATSHLPVSTSVPNLNLPVQEKLRRCVIDNYGNIIHYLDSYNSYYADGVSATVSGTITADTTNHLSDTGQFTSDADAYKGYYAYNLTDDTYALILDKYSNDALLLAQDIFSIGEEYEICTGAIGGVSNYSVMVEIPKFYYRHAYNSISTVHTWEISEYPQSGFSVHPAFIKNGSEVDNRYMSAYEGTGWDYYGGFIHHANTTTGWDSATAIDLDNDKLCSISGWNPVTNEYRSSFRAIAANRGTGWRQFDYDLLSAIQLLYIVEYADWYAQDTIGEGRAGLTGGAWTKESYIGITGKSNLDGNHTNSVDIGGTSYTTDYMTYRGIENLFGNVWNWIDGLNLYNRQPYVSNTDTDFADGTSTNYTALSLSLSPSDGWIDSLEDTPRGFLPDTVSGSSSTYGTDYYKQGADWKTALFGGTATAGGNNGVLCYAFNVAATVRANHIGGRLCY